jgi:hypothetical protein
MRLDPEAPIVPGRSAAGIDLGSRIEDILADIAHLLTPEPTVSPYSESVTTRYHSDSVDLWERGGIVRQIGVHGAYRGKLMERIGLGSTIADIETHIGECEESEEDNGAIKGLPGLCFDAEGDFPPAPHGVVFKHPALQSARVTAFYVFRR